MVARRPGRRRFWRLMFLSLACTMPSLATAREPVQPQFSLETLMRGLASISQRHERFTEEKSFAALDRSIVVAGELLYRQPAYLEKLTLRPRFERLTIDGDVLTLIDGGGATRRVDLGDQPELRGLIDAMRATLAGNLSTLQRSFQVTLAGSLPAWQLTLVPVSVAVARLVETVRIDGTDNRLTQVETTQANGNSSRMVIEPLP